MYTIRLFRSLLACFTVLTATYISSANQNSSLSENGIFNKSVEKVSSIHGATEPCMLFEDSVWQDPLKRNPPSSLADFDDNQLAK